MSRLNTYGKIEFKKGLPATTVAKVRHDLKMDCNVGDTEIYFDGEYLLPDDIIDCFKYTEIKSGRFETDDDGEEFLNKFINGEWVECSKGYLIEYTTDELVNELTRRRKIKTYEDICEWCGDDFFDGYDSSRRKTYEDICEWCGDDFFDDYNNSRRKFFVKHWENCGKDPWWVEGYAILNTMFGYDIGVCNAMEINQFIDEHYDVSPIGINGNNYTEDMVKAAVEHLGLILDFTNFKYTQNDFRYDWR